MILKEITEIHIINDNSSQTYCVNLFSQVATDNSGYYKPCCHFTGKIENESGQRLHTSTTSAAEFFNSSFMVKARQDTACGKEIQGCSQCYKLEKGGIESMRVRHNRERKSIALKVGTDPHQPTIYAMDLRFGNLCNAGCLMCHPHASSVLQKEWGQHGWTRFADHEDNSKEHSVDIHNWYKQPVVISQLAEVAHNVEHLWLIGGEPLINKKNMELLKSLVHRGKNLSLEISTNLSFLNEEIIDLLSNFNTILKCSIDGIGPVSDYIRYPTQFTDIEKNYYRILQAPIDVEIVHTTSVLNILHLKEFYFWVKSVSKKINKPCSLSVTNIVFNPKHLAIENLNQEIKDLAVEQINAILLDLSQEHSPFTSPQTFMELKNFLKTCRGNTEHIQNHWKFIENSDAVRKLSWKDICPWMNSVLESKRSCEIL